MGRMDGWHTNANAMVGKAYTVYLKGKKKYRHVSELSLSACSLDPGITRLLGRVCLQIEAAFPRRLTPQDHRALLTEGLQT